MRRNPKVPQRTVGVVGRLSDGRILGMRRPSVCDSAQCHEMMAERLTNANKLVGRQVSKCEDGSSLSTTFRVAGGCHRVPYQ